MAREVCGSPITYVDVGAATGDSILLVHANCPGAIARTYAVDGDEEFVQYLKHNTSQIDGCTVRKTMLSAGGTDVKELVRTHGGTASSLGTETTASMTLDEALRLDGIDVVHVLKTDVDGYDGEALAGGREILQRDRPAVIFEWNPACCRETGNDWNTAFEVLSGLGYHRFLWFTKYGEFSHQAVGFDRRETEFLGEYCARITSETDMHYDVIALHDASKIDEVKLADLAFARARTSRH